MSGSSTTGGRGTARRDGAASSTSTGTAGRGEEGDGSRPGGRDRAPAKGATAVADRRRPSTDAHSSNDATTGRPKRLNRKQRRAAAVAADSPARRARREAWERDRRTQRKHTAILVSGLLAVFLVIGGLITFGVYEVKKSPSLPVPAGVSTRTDGLVAGGSGPVTVEVYADYECPGCKTFQSTTFATLTSMIAKNQITLVYHPVAMLDELTGTQYSTRAADAAACAADRGVFLPYTQALFANQPKANSTGLSDDELVQLAGRAGIIDPRFAQCVRAQTYGGWIAQETRLASAHPVAAAPNVLVDGKPVTAYGRTPTAGALTTAVTTAAAAAAAKSRK
jgi:protein-disulfide isomerase